MGYIGKEVLKKNTFKRKPLEVPEWEGIILIRGLSGKEAGQVNQGALEIQSARQKGNLSADQAIRWQALTVVLGWIGENGSHVLEPSDIDALIEEKEHSVIERVAKEIRILTGIQAADPEVKPTDEAKKNSTTTPSVASGSA